MLGFFEWISDEMIPPSDAYDPAVGRPRCKKCGKDAWLMWNGKYSAYCSTECQGSDKRKGLLRSSVNSVLPSRGSRRGENAKAFQRAVAAKKAARDIKAIAEKWAAQRKNELQDDAYAGDAQQRKCESSAEDVRKSESFAKEEEFHKMQARLAQVAEALAKEDLRTEEKTPFPSFDPPGTSVRPVDAHIPRVNSSSSWNSEAAAIEQAFAAEIKRQAEGEERHRTSEVSGKALGCTGDVRHSAEPPLHDFSSSRRYKDIAIQTHLPRAEGSRREGNNTRSSHKYERDTEKGNVYTSSRHGRDEQGKGGNYRRTTLDNTMFNVPRAEYAHPIDLLEQSKTAANKYTTSFGERRVPRNKRCLENTRMESEKAGHQKTSKDSVYAQKPTLNEEDRPAIALNWKEDGTRPRQQWRNSSSLYGSHTHVSAPLEAELPNRVQNKLPCAITGKVDVHSPTKSVSPAKEPSSLLSCIPQGDMTSAASTHHKLKAFRVAGRSNKYVTFSDMQQLRDAAWRETKKVMEEACACSMSGEYSGNLELHLLSAENVNPARVSPDDRLYVIVRCQVAQKEWAEKQSKNVKNLRWDEALSFPLTYEKYPSGARVCVQLWKRASHQGDVDLFIGEGEIPFPLNATRCVLPVQLCWNTKLGGNVVDLDCGRLRVAVCLRQRMHAEAASSPAIQTEAVSTSATGTLSERQPATTLLQARTALKGTQKLAVRRGKVRNTSGIVKTASRKPAKYRAFMRNARDHKSNISIERKNGKTAEGAADLRWRSTGTRSKSSQSYALGISETSALLSTSKGSIKEDENIVGQGDKQWNAAVEVPRDTLGSQGVLEANTDTARRKKCKSSDAQKDGHSFRKEVHVIEDTDATEPRKFQDSIARAALTSPKALPLSKLTHSDSEVSGESPALKRNAEFSEDVPYSSVAAPASPVNTRVYGVEFEQYVSNTIVSVAGKQETISDSRPLFQGPSVICTLPSSTDPHNGISKAELQVLLPVTLAQMDDFTHLDAEPGSVAPAVNLDPHVLAQPWFTGRQNRILCANRSCRRIVSNRTMNDLFEEEEFRAWGCCSTCQGEMFHTKIPSSSEAFIQISADSGVFDEFRLESFIPLAFPTPSVIWPSSRHLFVAQRFTHVQIQDRLRQCRTQRELNLILMAPLLKYYVRSDWNTYRRTALRICVRLKIQQHPRLQLLLASTGRAVLYDPTLPDFWEWGLDEEAVRANVVGTLLMELRKEYL